MKPDESTVLQSEEPMEQQIRALEASKPKDDSSDSDSDQGGDSPDSEKASNAPSDVDMSQWQPL
jgi:hypothetical protein